MKNLFKLLCLMSLTVFLVISVIPVGAAAANCTFYHGMSGTYGLGETASTVVENHLHNSITVSFRGTNQSYTNTAHSYNSQYCIVYTDDLNGRKGSHICNYYVNGVLEHTSTEAWPFDFTN